MKDANPLSGKLKESGPPGFYDLKKVWNPTFFQGNRAKNRYFEGWYFKNLSPDIGQSWAFIPGISLAPDDEHSFVQVIDGKKGKTWYYRYPISAFAFSKKDFYIRIGDSTFSKTHLHLQLEGDTGRFQGKLSFSGQTPYKAGLLHPGIMGWYRYVPFMECYHGVVSLDHQLHGSLNICGSERSFEGGRGYIEKDWGSSMPKSWIWMQTNHFETPRTSFMLSVANIPWIGKSFTGFLGFLLYNGKRFDFATYTGAKLLVVDNNPEEIRIVIQHKAQTLTISGKKAKSGQLKAPVLGTMQRVIHESIDSVIRIKLTTTGGRVVFEGQGKNAGLELVGDTESLKP
ncbi:MAG: tocopherol cyclase family protein [Bacteroidales bacterium]